MKKLLIIGALAIAAPAHAVELIGNGSFEEPGTTDPCCTTVPTATLDDWTVETGNVNVVNGTFSSANGNLAFDGKQYLDLIGEGGVGSISQMFGTTIGKLYTLTFAYSHNLFGGLQSASANYSVAGVNGTVTHSTGSNTNLDWRTVNVNFVATGSNTTLNFANTAGGANEGIFLDRVSVTGVPEPTTWAMMLIGFAAVGFGMRRKKAVGNLALA